MKLFLSERLMNFDLGKESKSKKSKKRKITWIELETWIKSRVYNEYDHKFKNKNPTGVWLKISDSLISKVRVTWYSSSKNWVKLCTN